MIFVIVLYAYCFSNNTHSFCSAGRCKCPVRTVTALSERFLRTANDERSNGYKSNRWIEMGSQLQAGEQVGRFCEVDVVEAQQRPPRGSALDARRVVATGAGRRTGRFAADADAPRAEDEPRQQRPPHDPESPSISRSIALTTPDINNTGQQCCHTAI